MKALTFDENVYKNMIWFMKAFSFHNHDSSFPSTFKRAGGAPPIIIEAAARRLYITTAANASFVGKTDIFRADGKESFIYENVFTVRTLKNLIEFNFLKGLNI